MKGDEGNTGNPEGGAVELASAAKLVVRVVCDIDSSETPERYVLLNDLLCAAWPTERARNQ